METEERPKPESRLDGGGCSVTMDSKSMNNNLHYIDYENILLNI